MNPALVATVEQLKEQHADPGACQVELIGPDLRVVEIAQTPVSVPVAVRVHGRAPWDARVHTSHPAVTTSPADRCQLPPGRHTIQIRVDPSALDHAVADATVTLQGGAEHVAITLRFRRIRPPGWTRLEVVLLGLLGASLVGLGWWLGARTTIGQAPRTPGSEGDARQLPNAYACLEQAHEPLPRYVDVHTDGLGRPTGFSFDGVVSPDLETCMKEALLKLEFPPTRDGLSTFHRYHITRDPP